MRCSFFFGLILSVLFAVPSIAGAQRTITAFDFESPLNLKDWWVANKGIIVTQCGKPDCEQLPGSGKCLRIEWNQVPENSSRIWMTDLKIDTLGSRAMEKTWNEFKENTWLNFSANTGNADSVYFQLIIFTKDEKDKWGSKEIIGFKAADWKTVKVKLSSLHYSNWGKGSIAVPDLSSIIPARIEIGILSGKTTTAGKMDVRIDNILFTNQEP